MTTEELLAKHKKLTADLVKLEAAIEATRVQKSEVAKALYEANGKGHVYDLDGVEVIITTSSKGSFYFTPKDKWAKSGKPKREPKVKEPKEAKVRKPRVKKAIVGGQVVEVPVEAAAPPEAPPEAAHTMTRGTVTEGNPLAPEAEAPVPEPVQEAPVPEEAPQAAPEVKKELDPVEAALAAIEGLDV